MAAILTDSVPERISQVPEKCRVARTWQSRRGLEERKRRFPEWSPKTWHNGPPKKVKKMWRRKIRAKYRQEMRRNGDDPMLVSYNKRISEMLWNWY